MTDIDARNPPGYVAVTKSLQEFASEMQRLSKDSVDQTAQHMERLRGARTIEEVISIQTAFLQRSFANYTDYNRRFSELMLSLPMELARQSQSAFQQGTRNVSQAAEQAGEEARHASGRVSQD